MRRTPKLPALAAATLIALAAAAQADSFASSAISNSFSASVGSISTSFNASSDASSPGRPLNAGVYRVMDVAVAPGREGYARLTLRAEADSSVVASAAPAAPAASEARDEFLYLPLATVTSAGLSAGQVIQARARPYGLELARAAVPGRAAEAFFLVVADDVYRELQTRAVRL